jgi:hypothetical protein
MFDETEYALLELAFDEVATQVAPFTVLGTYDAAASSAFSQRVLDEQERVIGYRPNRPKEFMHHRLADFGPSCPNCGRLLRTPRASKCMECGTPRSV